MVLKRKLYQKMLEWKNTDAGTSVLMIDGARRVGKSFLCRQFGENEYKSMILIDFGDTKKRVTDIFEDDSDDLDDFFNKLSARYRTTLYKRESLIVFDEVQKYPLARQMLKYLVEDGRYDYIETGSLLTLKQNTKGIIIPSEEEHVELHPLDFEEFLWAMEDDVTMDYVRQCFDKAKPLGQTLHRRILNDFRQYILVGGMPQSVLAYAQDKNFAMADRVKKRILKLYENDVTKYATGYESKVLGIFDNIPGQLSKKEKKYKLSAINENARMRSYDDAFIWLREAMIANPCYNATDPTVGLGWSMDNTTHKLYMADTGLLVTHAFRDKSYMSNDLYRSILLDKLNVNEGMLMENAVAQMLRTNGHRLFFYSRVDKNNRANMMEIDFLISREGKICPVEVKSSAYREHSSLDKFRRKFAKRLGDAYLLYSKDVMKKEGVIHLPLYMASLL